MRLMNRFLFHYPAGCSIQPFVNRIIRFSAKTRQDIAKGFRALRGSPAHSVHTEKVKPATHALWSGI